MSKANGSAVRMLEGPAAARAVKPRGFLWWKYQRIITLSLGPLLLVCLEAASRLGLVSQFVLPAPTDVIRTLYGGMRSGVYVGPTVSTGTAMLEGYVLGVVLATSLAAIVTTFRYLEAVIMPYVFAFETLPKIAIAPLVILWFGFGDTSKITIVTLTCFFPMFLNSVQGLRIRDRDMYHLFRSLGASKWQMIRHLRVPSSMPYVFAGLQMAAIFALIGTIVAEFVGSQNGLGVLLLQQQSLFNLAGEFSVLLLLMMMGSVLYGVIRLIESRVAFWARDVSGDMR